jgi:hypothetical protein
MTTYKAANRIVPPLVVLGIVGCVWYATSSQPKPTVALPGPQPVAAASSVSNGPKSAAADQQPVADIAPTINKLGHQVRLSVDTTQFKQVQKVEFYIESKLVGAAFSQPYAVSVDEDNLTAGTHSVTAKVYTPAATSQTIAALFTATPDKSARPTTSDDDKEDAASAPAVPTTSNPSLVAPANLTAAVTSDGVGAQLTWDSVATATAYQVWRDGALVATVSGTSYTDTGLNQGQTYDYSLITVGAGGSTSAPSGQIAVTMPGAPAPPSGTGNGQGTNGNPPPPSAQPGTSTGDIPASGSAELFSDPSLEP